MSTFQSIEWQNGKLHLLDQRVLPQQTVFQTYTSAADVAVAIREMVTRGAPGPDQEALLARGARFPLPMYSCLAGFVEPGEDLEGAVVREVREEVGLTVGNVRYAGSQPWPFPNSLMIGFRADYLDGDIVLEDDEIVDARWCRRDDMPAIPPGISIANKIIQAWLSEET